MYGHLPTTLVNKKFIKQEPKHEAQRGNLVHPATVTQKVTTHHQASMRGKKQIQAPSGWRHKLSVQKKKKLQNHGEIQIMH